jgi:hypothetical protein
MIESFMSESFRSESVLTPGVAGPLQAAKARAATAARVKETFFILCFFVLSAANLLCQGIFQIVWQKKVIFFTEPPNSLIVKRHTVPKTEAVVWCFFVGCAESNELGL